MDIADSDTGRTATARPSDASVCWHFHRLLRATAPADEPPEHEEARANAIADMYQALAPTDAWQAGRACRLIEMDFMLQTALRALNDAADTPEKLPKLRASTLAASRELRQYEARYEKSRAAAARAAEALAAGAGAGAAKAVLPASGTEARGAAANGTRSQAAPMPRTEAAPSPAAPTGETRPAPAGQARPAAPIAPPAPHAAAPTEAETARTGGNSSNGRPEDDGLGSPFAPSPGAATPRPPEHCQRLPEVDAFMENARARLEADSDADVPLSETFKKLARSG